MAIDRTFRDFGPNYDLFVDFPENRHQYPIDITSNDAKREYMVVEAINIRSSNFLSTEPDTRGRDDDSLLSTEGQQRNVQRTPRDQQATLRPEATFFLPMPNVVGDRLDHSWGERENIVNTPGGLGSVESFLKSAAGESISGVRKRLAETFVPRSVLAGESLSLDKKTAVLFDVTQRRSFTFLYEMAPRSEEECREIIAIVRKLKYYSASTPTEVEGFTFFQYPEVFRVNFYRDGQINENLFKIDTAALTNIEMNYTPEQVFSQFKNGFPTTLRLSLTFKELNILTKPFIQRGF